MSKKTLVDIQFSFNPLEETLEYDFKKKSLFIGIPRESLCNENRVALIPQAVATLVNNGNRVVVEHNAGKASSYSDKEYSDAGARICYNKNEVFEAEIILKTAPLFDEELVLLKENQTIFSTIHTPNLSRDYLQTCLDKKIIAIALGSIKDDAGHYPVVRSMSQIAGVLSIQIAAQYLSNNENGRGVLLGGIDGVPPASVVIIGAGMVGEYATRTALGCGAQVKVFDNSIYRLMRLQRTVGQTVYTSVIDPIQLGKVLKEADVAIGALKPQKGTVPMVVSEEMVMKMKSGSVIIDVSIDNGGCFETSEITSHKNPVFTKHNVVHYCVPNIASGVSRTASKAISNIIMPLILSISETAGNGKNLLYDKTGLVAATYAYKGKMTSKVLSQKFGFKYTDLNLILSSNF